jgi:flagellar biosynthesis/type III secretory pathway protein FliH
VAPESVAEVQGRLADIMADYAGISFIEVQADTRLRRGGCILESEFGGGRERRGPAGGPRAGAEARVH